MKTALLYVFIFAMTTTSFGQAIEGSVMPNEGAAIATCSTSSTPVLKASSSTQLSFFNNLFDTSLWPARWYCGVWTDFHGWMYITSDLMIWAAYFLIPLILGYFLFKRRKEVPFHSILFLFIAFILACGFTHLVDAAIFWWPAYKLSAVVRMGTAIISWGTVLALVKVTPRVMDFKSPAVLERIVQEKTAELQALNAQLQLEIEEKSLAQEKLEELNHSLERQVEERTQSLEKTNNELDYFNGLLEAVQQAANIGVWEVDLEADTIYWSDQVYDIHEIPRGTEVKLDQAINFYHHDYRHTVQQAVEKAVNVGEGWNLKLKLVTAKGNEIWVHAVGIPYVINNKTIKLRGLFQDIDKTEKDQIIIQENRQNLSAIIENTDDLIWSIDTNYKLTIFNTQFAQATNEVYSKPLEIGHSVLGDLLPKEVRAYWKEKYDAVLKSKEQLVWVEENSQNHTFSEISLNPILGSEKELLGVSGFSRDITSSKRQEETIKEINNSLEAKVTDRTKELNENNVKLAAINKELESFSYSVSHDLRAPLRGIYGFTNAIKEDYEHLLDDDGKNYLERVMAGVTRMGALIDDLLSLSRVTRKSVEKEEIDLSQMVIQIFNSLESKNTTIEIAKGLKAFGDPNLVSTALQNLIENAVKYSSKIANPHIEFGAKQDNGKTVYFISDNGAGFDMNYVHKLFSPFQRLHSNEDFKGNGIGLATVKRIFLKHGGDVWGESVEKQGSTFYFTLN